QGIPSFIMLHKGQKADQDSAHDQHIPQCGSFSFSHDRSISIPNRSLKVNQIILRGSVHIPLSLGIPLDPSIKYPAHESHYPGPIDKVTAVQVSRGGSAALPALGPCYAGEQVPADLPIV